MSILSLLTPVAIALALQSQLPPDGTDRPGTIRASEVDGRAPDVDGRLTDQAWAGVEIATDFVQAEPAPGEPATQRTEVRVVRSGGALYIGARLHDSEPHRIRAPLARRDEDVVSDWFFVYLDSNRDRATATAFGVNPRGLKRDFLIDEEGREIPDWTAVWDVAVSVDSLGWTVEMRIPLSQLRFGGAEEGSGDAHWGVNFERRVPRNGEVTSWIQLPRSRRQILSSLGDLTGMEGVGASLRLEATPYSLARMTPPPLGSGGDPQLFATAGADLKLGITSSLTFTGTFNPDFGQVEADPAVVNVSGFRTFFPEKRPFFLEDQGFFQYDVGRTRIFHSRRIGRDVEHTGPTRSSFQAVPDASGILAASKLSGRTPGGWSLGVLHAVTNSEVLVVEDSVGVELFEPVAPRANYLVTRVTRETHEGRGSIGGVFTLTHRQLDGDLLGELPSRAFVGGATWGRRSEDGLHHLSAGLLGSHVEGAPAVLSRLQTAHGRYFQRPDAGHLELDSLRTRLTGFAANVSVERVEIGGLSWGAGSHLLSPSFEANDLGHQREADAIHQYAHVGYDHLGDGLLLRRRRLTLTQWSDWTFGGERTSTGGRAELQLQLKSYWGAVMQVERHLPHLSPDQLRGGAALFMPGSTRHRLVLYTDPRRGLTLRLDGGVTTEEQTGGSLHVFRGTLSARPAGIAAFTLEPSLVERRGSLEYTTRRTTSEGTHYLFGEVHHRTLSLVSRLDLAFTPTLSLQLYAQPYLVTREVDEFREVRDPRGPTLATRFDVYAPHQIEHDPERERYHVDRTGDGAADFSFPDPGFTYGQFSSNVVLRWEFRPASTLYLVWSHDFRDRASPGSLHPMEGMADLFGLGRAREAPATNVLLLKLSYWLSP